MKNREKFAKEILDIVCNGDDVAMDKDTMKLRACNRFSKFECLKCLNCYFHEENFPLHTKNCIANFVHWANSEYKEKKEFTEREKTFVKLSPNILYIARDKDGELYIFTSKPKKGLSVWAPAGEPACWIPDFMLLEFNSIKWDDEEPTHRSEILGE